MIDKILPYIMKFKSALFDVPEQTRRPEQPTEALNSDGTQIKDQYAYLKESSRNHAFMDGVNQHPRSTPKGTSLSRHTNDEAILSIRCVRQFWWWAGPTAAAVFSGFVIPFAVVLIFASFDTEANAIGWILLFACIFGLFISYQTTRVWLEIIIHKDKISVGNRVFDRAHTSGFRTGYSIDTEDGLKNDFMDQSMGFSGLRLSYGPWGEDLPYLVNKYHSAEILVWLNAIMDNVGKPEPAAQDLEAGRKKDTF